MTVGEAVNSIISLDKRNVLSAFSNSFYVYCVNVHFACMVQFQTCCLLYIINDHTTVPIPMLIQQVYLEK
jgi:hypothetical protein